MKKTIILLVATAAIFALPSCEKITGEGPLQTETRAHTGFSGVSSSIPGKIHYTIASNYEVKITAQRNILDVIETFNENGHLRIKIRNGVRVREHEDIVVAISAPSANYLHLSGAGDVEVSGNLSAPGLDMRISGSGTITVDRADITGKIEATISGSGDMKIRGGTARDQDLKISGSGKMIFDGVSAQNGLARISGSGDIYVNLAQTLDATISGSGSVYYRGTPQISTHISGSGSVRPL